MSALDKIITSAEMSGWTREISADRREAFIVREGSRLHVLFTSTGAVRSATLLAPGRDAREIGTREAGKLALVLGWLAEEVIYDRAAEYLGEAGKTRPRPAWWLASREASRARAQRRIASIQRAAEAQLSRGTR